MKSDDAFVKIKRFALFMVVDVVIKGSGGRYHWHLHQADASFKMPVDEMS